MGNPTKKIHIDLPEFSDRVLNNLEKVIVGKRTSLEFTLLTLLCEGHLLIEDIPGVGKTMLARSLAISLGCDFSRIQFTPDMLPSDVTGVSIFNQNITNIRISSWLDNFQYRFGG
jgi:MoxR-like ATPase